MIFFRCETYRPLLQNMYIDYFSIYRFRFRRQSSYMTGASNIDTFAVSLQTFYFLWLIRGTNCLIQIKLNLRFFAFFLIKFEWCGWQDHHIIGVTLLLISTRLTHLKRNKHKILKTNDIKLVVNNKANLKCQWQLWFEGKKHSNCEFGIS